jgi:N-acetylglucosamine kinase-like BadF-type ATPase
VTAADRIVLAIDAGGSGARCLAARGDGTVLGRGRGGPANHILAGWETARASLREAIDTAIEAAQLGGRPIDAAVIGSSGVGADGLGREVIEDLLAGLVPGVARVHATGDMVAGFWGALREPAGVVVSAGTGAVGFGRSPSGATCQVDGWGHIMGDEGSAYDIAVQALRAVARAADGRGAPTALTEALARALGGRTALDIAGRVYGEPMGREQIAGLAVHVARAAATADPTAVAILRRTGEALGATAAALLQRLELTGAAMVSYSGSVFAAGDPVLAAFAAAVHSANPQAQVVPPLLPPVGGAFRIAAKMLEVPFDDAVIARLQNGLAQG